MAFCRRRAGEGWIVEAEDEEELRAAEDAFHAPNGTVINLGVIDI